MKATRIRPGRNGHAKPRGDFVDGTPPCDIEAEQAVLGSIMVDPKTLEAVGAIVQPSDFLDDRHSRLFEHLQNAPAGHIVDTTLLCSWLKAAGDLERCGGRAHLVELLGSVGAPSNAPYYAKIVRETAMRRRLVAQAIALGQAAYLGGDDLATLAAELRASLPEAEEAPAEPPLFLKMLDSRELAEFDGHPRFLVRDVLAAGQPCVIGGRSKTLKTSVMLDLAVSLASGMPFLNRFAVPRPASVALWSGESGEATIRETAMRIADSKNLDLAGLPISWGFSLPKLSKADHLAAMVELIKRRSIEVAVVDPLYLSLLTADAAGKPSDVFFMGATLEPLTAIGRETGCTIVLLHHFRKGAGGNGQGDDSDVCALEDLSQAGIVEWARQWLLLQRRQPYEGAGEHALWMRTGGSAGHAGLWALDISEGELDPDTWSGRTWQVDVRCVCDVRAEVQRERQDRKARLQEETDSQHLERLLGAMGRFPGGETARKLRTAARLSNDAFTRAMATLESEGRVEETTIEKQRGRYDGFRLKT